MPKSKRQIKVEMMEKEILYIKGGEKKEEKMIKNMMVEIEDKEEEEK